MKDRDFNINHYSLEDILNLYNLSPCFSRTQLREVYRCVLSMHPDKNPSIDVEQFRFFLKTYKLLAQIYQTRERATMSQDQYSCTREKDINSVKLSKQQMDALDRINKSHKDTSTHKDFNRWFNTAFEETTKPLHERNPGYEEWISEQRTNSNTLSQGKQLIQQRRQQLRQQSQSEYPNLSIIASASSQPTTYLDPRETTRHSTNPASTFFTGTLKKTASTQYRDLKEAHEHSIVDVDDSLDYKPREDYEKYKMTRSQLNITKQDYRRANREFERKEEHAKQRDQERIFNMLREEEEAKEANERMWKRIMTLKNA
jgi:hypothetical protein